ncbi:MAG: VWA domain-containing protein [Proteobacteria bacterium]|nr:VWA domain-containing protein [Pseudomonadota bacterium]
MKKLAYLSACLLASAWLACAGIPGPGKTVKPVSPVQKPASVDEGAEVKNTDGTKVERATIKPEAAPAETEAAKGKTGAGLAEEPIPAPASPAPAMPALAKEMAAGPARKATGATLPPSSPGIKAGASDDNRQFNFYLDYLGRFPNLNVLKLDVSNRIIFQAEDRDGRSIPNCHLSFRDGSGKTVAERRTYADGRAIFFPSEYAGKLTQGLRAITTCGQKTLEQSFDPSGVKNLEIKFDFRRESYKNVPLDIAFVFDTTGSMGDEIARLKQTIEVIHFQITQLSSLPDVRFGMVLYRDRGDEYVTRVIPFTSRMEVFKQALDQVRADGGGDEPEEVQAGLKDALKKLEWRPSGIRLLFLIGDAPPHLDYGQEYVRAAKDAEIAKAAPVAIPVEYTYLQAMRDAAGQAIKIVSIGASGLNNEGEYVFRQLSQYTMGIFAFLTYGESGEAEGGGGTTYVSHHTGSNWQAENLDAIIVKMVKVELANLTDQPVSEGEDYFEVTAGPGADRDKVLDDLFTQAVKQLLDYSTVLIREKTPTVLMPVSVKDPGLKAASELLEDRLELIIFKLPQFQMLERKNLQQLIGEMSLQLNDLFDNQKTVEVGKMAGAQLALMGKLSPGKEKLELFLKLVRIETGEIISVTMVKIDPGLLK